MFGLRAPWGCEGGVEQAVAGLAPELVALGCEVTVYCRRRHNPLGSVTREGVRLVDLPSPRRLEAFLHSALAAPVATLGADLVHIHAIGPAFFSWVPRTVRATVVTVHALDWQREKWGPLARAALRMGERSAAHFAHRIIAVGEHLAAHLRRYGVHATVIPNGVAPIPFVPLDRSGVPGLEPFQYFLFLGRLVPEKGLDALIAGWRASGVTMPLVIAGGGTGEHPTVASLRSSGARFVGPRFGAERDALLSNARAVVSASRLEGFPLVALEAMAAGRPVLLSDLPGHREVLGPLDGIVHDWPGAFRRLAADPEPDGAAGRARVLESFSWRSVALRTLAVYEDVMRTRRP